MSASSFSLFTLFYYSTKSFATLSNSPPYLLKPGHPGFSSKVNTKTCPFESPNAIEKSYLLESIAVTASGKSLISNTVLKSAVVSLLFIKHLNSFLPAPPAKIKFPLLLILAAKTYPLSDEL